MLVPNVVMQLVARWRVSRLEKLHLFGAGSQTIDRKCALTVERFRALDDQPDPLRLVQGQFGQRPQHAICIICIGDLMLTETPSFRARTLL